MANGIVGHGLGDAENGDGANFIHQYLGKILSPQTSTTVLLKGKPVEVVVKGKEDDNDAGGDEGASAENSETSPSAVAAANAMGLRVLQGFISFFKEFVAILERYSPQQDGDLATFLQQGKMKEDGKYRWEALKNMNAEGNYGWGVLNKMNE